MEKVNVLMPHWQGSLTAGESLGNLRWGPDGYVTPADILLVKDIGESSDLVLLVIEKGLKCHDMSSHQITDCIFG